MTLARRAWSGAISSGPGSALACRSLAWIWNCWVFYVCVVDLEDELIRAVGAASVQAVLEFQGDLDSFRTLQKQPVWREQRVEAQLRRFIGSAGGRKIRYGRLFVDALDLARVPRPLYRVLAHV